jgi:hypothetical protein
MTYTGTKLMEVEALHFPYDETNPSIQSSHAMTHVTCFNVYTC